MSTDSRRSHSPAPHSQSRTRPTLSHQPSLNGMTRRPTKDVSLSPRRRSLSSSARRSSWGRRTSPCDRLMFSNRRRWSFCSRSSNPCSSRRPRSFEYDKLWVSSFMWRMPRSSKWSVIVMNWNPWRSLPKLSVISPSFWWSGPWSSVFCLSWSDEYVAVSDERGQLVD